MCEFALTLNAKITKHKLSNKKYYASFSNPLYSIGNKKNSSTEAFNGKITCLNIFRRISISLDKVIKFYRLTKDYIIDNQLIDSNIKTVDFSQSTLYRNNNNNIEQFEIYPLHNCVKSLNNKLPINFDLRKVSLLDKGFLLKCESQFFLRIEITIFSRFFFFFNKDIYCTLRGS